jgi:CHASE2 domain-containing sensor protein
MSKNKITKNNQSVASRSSAGGITETGFEYNKTMLYIGIAALAFAVLSYISLLIKSLIRIVMILLILAVGYVITKQF